MSQIEEIFGEVVFSYSREQAIADGVLVDVSQYAKEFGYRYPVAVTRAVWQDCIDWDNINEQAYQDESGRLYDILWMAALAAKRTKGSYSLFDIERIAKDQIEPSTVVLKSIIGPGDTAEPVITIMQPEED
jgi:hypothetical protein